MSLFCFISPPSNTSPNCRLSPSPPLAITNHHEPSRSIFSPSMSNIAIVLAEGCLVLSCLSMDSQSHIAGKCVQGIGLELIDGCRSLEVDVVGKNRELAHDEELSVLSSTTSKSKEVVLAFDSL
ncbi:hypothetical protein L6452_22813 [Arctium lappa]|uniref:Uncharacterized protein n=1 Tax=Arctium lappa TaxID=4217 RepID=A0ACB9B570_ARCLA|nr:hypothetical protein L6452_22813 [Arctium lappa]